MFIFKVIKKVWILVVLIFISLFYSFDNCNYHPKNNELKTIEPSREISKISLDSQLLLLKQANELFENHNFKQLYTFVLNNNLCKRVYHLGREFLEPHNYLISDLKATIVQYQLEYFFVTTLDIFVLKFFDSSKLDVRYLGKLRKLKDIQYKGHCGIGNTLIYDSILFSEYNNSLNSKLLYYTTIAENTFDTFCNNKEDAVHTKFEKEDYNEIDKLISSVYKKSEKLTLLRNLMNIYSILGNKEKYDKVYQEYQKYNTEHYDIFELEQFRRFKTSFNYEIWCIQDSFYLIDKLLKFDYNKISDSTINRIKKYGNWYDSITAEIISFGKAVKNNNLNIEKRIDAFLKNESYFYSGYDGFYANIHNSIYFYKLWIMFKKGDLKKIGKFIEDSYGGKTVKFIGELPSLHFQNDLKIFLKKMYVHHNKDISFEKFYKTISKEIHFLDRYLLK